MRVIPGNTKILLDMQFSFCCLMFISPFRWLLFSAWTARAVCVLSSCCVRVEFVLCACWVCAVCVLSLCCVRVEFVLCARCVLRFNFGLGNLHTLTFQFNNSGAYLKHSKGYITWNPEALSIFIFPNHIYIKIIVFQYIPAYAQLPRLVLMRYSSY